jgi:hypothetical protein
MKPAQYQSHRGGDGRVAEDGHDFRAGDSESVGDGGIAALKADHGGADQGRVEEEHDEVLAQIEQETEDQKRRLGIEPLDLVSEDAQRKQRGDEAGRQDDRRDRRAQRKDQQFLVLTQNLTACLDQRPAA